MRRPQPSARPRCAFVSGAGFVFPCDPTQVAPYTAANNCSNNQTGTRINSNRGGGAGIRPELLDGSGSYNAFQAQLKRAQFQGVQGQLSYTLGKCRDTSSAPVTGDTYLNSIAVPLLSFTNSPVTPPSGQQFCSNVLGNTGRNRFYGPGLTTVDFSVFKNFPIEKISETFNEQFRAEFFNILNHTNFLSPGFLNTFGQNNSVYDFDGSSLPTALNQTSTSSRQIQLGLKLVW